MSVQCNMAMMVCQLTLLAVICVQNPVFVCLGIQLNSAQAQDL